MIRNTIGYVDLSPEEAKQRIEDSLNGTSSLQILDVRSQEEFRLHYLPGSKLIPLSELEKRLAELDPLQEILVVSQFDNRAQAACALLGGKGFGRLYHLQGGIQSYPGLVLGRRALERFIAG
jgi:adenylyltransferase/sulfurtransferase